MSDIRELLRALTGPGGPLEGILAQVIEMPPIEGNMDVTLHTGRSVLIPMGPIAEHLAEEAREVSSSTPGCPCPGCSVRIRIAHAIRHVWNHSGFSLAEQQEVYNKEVNVEDEQKVLREANAWFRAKDAEIAAGAKAAAKSLPAREVKELTEGVRTQDMTAQATKTAKNGDKLVDRSDEKKFVNVKVVREGERIVLPEGMTYLQGREWLEKQELEEEQTIGIDEKIDAFPLEGALAFAKALDRKFGFIEKLGTPNWFGTTPPQTVSLVTGPGTVTQVPWGRVSMPGIHGFLQTSVGWTGDGKPTFAITGNVKQKSKDLVHEIVALTRTIAKEESIYKGRALRMHFPNREDDEEWTPLTGPSFMDLSQVKPEELIFPKETEDLVNINIITPIRKTQACRDNQIPLKRGILLEGAPGCGKTLTASVTAKECQDNNWTFIYLDDVADLAQAIHFAKRYEPACIFAEDIDREVSGERDDEIDEILNTIDGVDTKGSEIMVVVTTNYVEKITTEAIRPGRFDAVIPVKAPDGPAAERLVRLYARDLLSEGADLHKVGKALEGKIPAVIREIVERSKLAAVFRTPAGQPLRIEPTDLIATAQGMAAHLELLNKKTKKDEDIVAQIGTAVGVAISAGVKEAVSQSKANGNGDKHTHATA